MKRALAYSGTGAALALSPMIVFAGELGQIGTFFNDLFGLVNGTLIPLMFALCILAFFYGIFTYFIVGGGDEGKRAEGRQLMLWAIIGFVVMVSLYGIINILSDVIGVDEKNRELKGGLPTAPKPTKTGG